jgi:myo-inositol-1(or 4)-monophosphatase
VNEAEPYSIDEMADFATVLAAAARGETLKRFREPGEVMNKSRSGFDPVTLADRAAETAMRGLIEETYPKHGIAGEEYPDRPSQGSCCWSLDPIDGTRSFICGVPTWTTLIALLEGGSPVLGLIDAPQLGELYLGHGRSAHLMKQSGVTRLEASDCSRVSQARFSTTDPFLFDPADAEAFERVRRVACTIRYGHDAYAYALLAAGTIDLVVEGGLKPHDYNALVPVVRASGGVIGNWRGEDDFSGGKILAAATAALFEEAVGLLRG